MIRDNQKYFNRLLVLLDAVVIAASYFAAWFLWLGGSVVELLPGTGILAKEIYFSVLLVVIPGYFRELDTAEQLNNNNNINMCNYKFKSL